MICFVQQEKERIIVGKWQYFDLDFCQTFHLLTPQVKCLSWFEPEFCYTHVYHNSKKLYHVVCSYLNFQSAQHIKEVCSELLDAEASIHELFKNT